MTTLNMVPEFTSDDNTEADKPANTGDPVVETETPTVPPTDDKPVDSEPYKPESNVDTSELERQVAGLRADKNKLIHELKQVRGQIQNQKRNLKNELVLDKKEIIPDALEDIHPQDVELIEKVLRSKGYVTREEAQKMSYKAIQDEELKKFLEEFPEYKEENDVNDLSWNTLQRAISIYASPTNPRGWAEVLRRAHRDIAQVPSDATPLAAKRQQLKTAGVGAGGGVQKSSPRKSFDPERKAMLKHGGFTDEDIARMESRL